MASEAAATAMKEESPTDRPPPKVVRKHRRRYTLSEKRAILARVDRATGQLKDICRFIGISPGLINTWKRDGIKPAVDSPADADAAGGQAKRRAGRPSPYSDRERAFHLTQASAPGTDIKAYCKAHGLSLSAFYKWRERARAAAVIQAPAALVVAERAPSDGLTRELEELRMENTILKGVLQLAELRGFRLFELGDQPRGGKRR